MTEPRANVPRLIWRGPGDGRSVALTFDDGPHPEVTPRLLDILEAHGAQATFFLVGSRAARWPRLVARIAEAGHLIGSHGYAHRGDWWRSAATLGGDIDRAEDILGGIMPGPKLFRPPYGLLSPSWYRAARERGYTCVLWNVTGRDWRTADGDRVAARLVRRARPGTLVLLHECRAETGDGYGHTLTAVEQYLSHADARGWRMATVAACIDRRRTP